MNNGMYFEMEEMIMEEEKSEKQNILHKKKKGQDATDLPFCTTTDTAEQARANDDSAPCDDGRSGRIDED